MSALYGDLLKRYKISSEMPIYSNAYAKIKKIEFSMFSSQEIGSNLLSFEKIFEALQSELSRFKSHSLSSKILKILEFNLLIAKVELSRYS